ncbi:MAG TPA: hypothetical protein GXX55_01135 [Firmicutes bacterium]|nr:hypothetical protein [Bacillota bacterium]
MATVSRKLPLHGSQATATAGQRDATGSRAGGAGEVSPDPVRAALLFDFYGGLLTPRQQEVFRLYHHENLSLGEIAALGGVSRQAVHDLLRRSWQELARMEKTLGVVARYQEYRRWRVRWRQSWEDWQKEIPPLREKKPAWEALLAELDELQSPGFDSRPPGRGETGPDAGWVSR